MTLVVTSVVIYIYSAVAFSFFRKFYVQEVESGYVRDNCGNMLTVSLTIFPLYSYFLPIVLPLSHRSWS